MTLPAAIALAQANVRHSAATSATIFFMMEILLFLWTMRSRRTSELT